MDILVTISSIVSIQKDESFCLYMAKLPLNGNTFMIEKFSNLCQCVTNTQSIIILLYILCMYVEHKEKTYCINFKFTIKYVNICLIECCKISNWPINIDMCSTHDGVNVILLKIRLFHWMWTSINSLIYLNTGYTCHIYSYNVPSLHSQSLNTIILINCTFSNVYE